MQRVNDSQIIQRLSVFINGIYMRYTGIMNPVGGLVEGRVNSNFCFAEYGRVINKLKYGGFLAR